MTVDRLICGSGLDAVLVFTSVAVVLLYLHPDPQPTTIIYDETTALVGVAWGVIIGRAVGPAHVMTALMETKTASMYVCVYAHTAGAWAWCKCLNFFVLSPTCSSKMCGLQNAQEIMLIQYFQQLKFH